MFERLFMPALTLTMLAAALGAFVTEIAQSHLPPQRIVQLDRVVVSAQRPLPATPVARADAAPPSAAVVR